MVPGKRNRFVIFCTARSGSYRTVELLNQFPSIVCHGELFKPGRIELDKALQSAVKFDVAKRDKTPLVYMNSVYRLSPAKITGFKIFNSHPAKVRSTLIADPHVRKVILHRNAIDMYLSFLRAHATERWVDRGNRGEVQSPPLQFDAVQFAGLASRHANFYQTLGDAAALRPALFHKIDYADLAVDDCIRKLAAFLGETVLDVPLEGKMQKQFVERYEDVVSNYGEMIEVLERDYPALLENSDVAKQRAAARNVA